MSFIIYLSLPLTSSNILAIYIPVSPNASKMIPEKKETVIIIPAVPGTDIFVNFMYKA